MTRQGRAYLFAITAILLWSTIGSALKITLRYISFPELLFYASLSSVVIFSIAIVGQGKFRDLLNLKGHDFIRASLLGLLNPFLYYFVLLKAYDLLLAQEAGTLNYIWPVVLVLLSIPLLKQKIGWLSILAVGISFAGTIVIATHGNILSLSFSNPLGVTLALISAIFWAVFWIYNVKDTNGPPVIMLLSSKSRQPVDFRSTLQSYFFFTGLGIVGGHFIAGNITMSVLTNFLLSVPALFIAFLAGELLFRKFRTDKFYNFVYALLFILGIALIVRAVL
jgi:hypothetical protein